MVLLIKTKHADDKEVFLESQGSRNIPTSGSTRYQRKKVSTLHSKQTSDEVNSEQGTYPTNRSRHSNKLSKNNGPNVSATYTHTMLFTSFSAINHD